MQTPQPTVAYYYSPEIPLHCYGELNPMRPHRTKLVHTLVEGYATQHAGCFFGLHDGMKRLLLHYESSSDWRIGQRTVSKTYPLMALAPATLPASS